MKGVLFTVLEEVVVERFGEDTWDAVLRRSGVDGAYTSLGDYPDAELSSVVQALADELGLPANDVLVVGGTLAFPVLVTRHSYVMEGLKTWKDVLIHLGDIIHPEVRKIYPRADAPEFVITAVEGGVHLEYFSKRRLCRLAEGLVRGTGDWFSTPVAVEHLSCIEQGDPSCVLSVIG
jgi:Haem-NO-binding